MDRVHSLGSYLVFLSAHRPTELLHTQVLLPFFLSSSPLAAPCSNSRSRSLICAPPVPCCPSAGLSHSAASIPPHALPVQWVSGPLVLAHLNPELHWSHLLAMFHDYTLPNWTGPFLCVLVCSQSNLPWGTKILRSRITRHGNF